MNLQTIRRIPFYLVLIALAVVFLLPVYRAPTSSKGF